MKAKLVSYMQMFSKAIIVPVLYLPVVGVLLALSTVLTNPNMLGGIGFLKAFGDVLSGGLWTIFNNLSMFFAIGIAISLAKGKKAEAGIVAFMTYLIFLGSNNAWLRITDKLIPASSTFELYGSGQTFILGFQVVDMGAFLGIILGIVIAIVHNKYSKVEFPGVLSIYGNVKFVVALLVPITMILAVLFSYIWPFIALGITALTGVIKNTGAFGVFLFGFLERFLIPTGLHHLVWAPFSFTDVGGAMMIDGKNYFGASNIFLAQIADPSTVKLADSTAFVQYGIVKMFGTFGVAMAFFKTAKEENKKKLKGLLTPAILTAFFVGLTEPFEFMFLFAAPQLWVVYAVMAGLAQAALPMLGIHTCSFGGVIDFLAYNLPAGATLTKWPLFIVAGIFVAIIYYVVFKFLIVKFNFKTPGREEEVSDEIENAVAGNVSDAETGRMIIEALGGKENILEVENCFTRLRVSINDSSVVDEVALKRTGALGVVKKDKHVQVVYGTKVPQIRSTVDSLLKKSV